MSELFTSAVHVHRNVTIFDSWQVKLHESAALVRMPLPKLARTTLGALVVTEVHTRDFVQELIENDVTDTQNFNWIAQLRYFLNIFKSFIIYFDQKLTFTFFSSNNFKMIYD